MANHFFDTEATWSTFTNIFNFLYKLCIFLLTYLGIPLLCITFLGYIKKVSQSTSYNGKSFSHILSTRIHEENNNQIESLSEKENEEDQIKQDINNDNQLMKQKSNMIIKKEKTKKKKKKNNNNNHQKC